MSSTSGYNNLETRLKALSEAASADGPNVLLQHMPLSVIQTATEFVMSSGGIRE